MASMRSCSMYRFFPIIRCPKFIIPRRNKSKDVNVVCKGSPSRILKVLLISLGMTILPRSSTRLTMPVAFIYILSFSAAYKAPLCKGGWQKSLISDWGILCRLVAYCPAGNYPSTAYAVPLPLGEGGFVPTIILQIMLRICKRQEIIPQKFLL